MSKLPWNERVISFQVNPESATMSDIVRMAEELVEARIRAAEAEEYTTITTVGELPKPPAPVPGSSVTGMGERREDEIRSRVSP